jgi:hypothetical protein
MAIVIGCVLFVWFIMALSALAGTIEQREW